MGHHMAFPRLSSRIRHGVLGFMLKMRDMESVFHAYPNCIE